MNNSSQQEIGTSITTRPQRLYYLDWLRVLAMISIFLYHSDRLFDFDGWHVKNGVTNLASSLHIVFFTQWMMPLFFIISGASVYYALKFRTAGRFAKERVYPLMRLFSSCIANIYCSIFQDVEFTNDSASSSLRPDVSIRTLITTVSIVPPGDISRLTIY